MGNSARRGRSRVRASLLAGVATVLVAALTACSVNDELAQDYREGSNKGYISAGYALVEIPPEDRGDPVEFAGVTEHGDEVSSADYAGEVLVVNFWYAACGPCIVEAPLLEEVWQEHQADDVAFLGVNIYDQPATAISFAVDNGVTYPSVIDITDKSVSLAFAAAAPLQAPPVTLVLDRQGRVAARIIGQLKSASILSTLVREASAESA